MLEIVCFTGNSGLTDYAVSLARAWGQDARLVTAQSLAPRFRTLGFEVLTPFRRSRHYPLDVLRFATGVLKRRPAMMLWQGPLKFPVLDGLLARLLRAAGVRCAVTVHDVLPHYPRPWSPWTYGFYYRSFERVVTHSQAALAGLRGLGVSAPILVVPHGVYDLFRLDAPTRAQARARVPGLADHEERCIVLFFGHLESRKGLFELLEVAALLREDRRVLFLIAGGESLSAAESARLRTQAATLPNVLLLAQRVPFEAVENLFCAADIVALPYQEGTTSGVLKLAMAFCRPVVASAVGDLPEQIQAPMGRCVPLGEGFVQRYADALLHVAADPARFLQGMETAAAAAQWPRIAQEIAVFLQEPERA